MTDSKAQIDICALQSKILPTDLFLRLFDTLSHTFVYIASNRSILMISNFVLTVHKHRSKHVANDFANYIMCPLIQLVQ